jgi:prephenate dehydrogenase
MSQFKRAVILGVGLLGGSLGLALQKKKLAKTVVGWGRDAKRLKKAVESGVVQEATNHLGFALEGADLVILCTPFTQFESLLKQCAVLAPAGCLVTEVGSVKGPAVARWHKAAGPLRFVASHPMAGGEKTGFENANDGLFGGAACFVTPLPVTNKRALAQITGLWKALGSRVTAVNPTEHDRLAGRVSHLPHAVAFALCSMLARQGKLGDFKFAGKGYSDTTRVAASDAQLWADIFSHHPKTMAAQLKALRAELLAMEKLMGKNAALAARLKKAADFRRKTA